MSETLAGVLGTEVAPNSAGVHVAELGLDSISCVVWLREVNRTLGLSLTMADVCSHPTFGELSALVEGAMGDLMSATVPGPSAAPSGSVSAHPSIAAHLRESLAAELELAVSDIDDDAPFVELGLDSITGVTWTRRLNTHFQLSLSATQVYSHPTVDELAGHLAGLLGQAVAPAAVTDVRAQPAPEAASEGGSRARGEAQEAALGAWLRASLARELELAESELDDDTPFVELGLDSITGVTWTRSINTQLQLSLSATTVYGYPTVSELARYLAEVERAGLPGAEAENGPGAEAAPEAETAPEVPPSPSSSPPPEPEAKPEPEPVASDRTGKRGVELVDIAVIGMSGAFPKAENLDEFWQNIVTGRDCVSEVPPSRWPVERYYDERPGTPGKSYSKWMGVMENAHHFDPLFFNISPGEAEYMDPQQRVLLQESWRCVEEAGYNPEALSGTQCGVFIGCSVNGYGGRLDETELSAHQNLGTNSAILASRISYTLNLKGPCLSIDTSCSSSLVAIANACDSLCLGDSDTALAGGVWVIPGPGVHVAMSQLRALSPDGRCYAFDERANGFVPAEGVGVLLLKRLADAQADGDRVQAVIKGWGVNQDGKSNGITAPSAEAQTQLQKRVYDKFGIDPADIELVEAHGTGTALGDPVEIDGLVQSFTSSTDRHGHCALGSVKSNIGHTACAAGVASSIKAILALKHETLPPTIQHERLNGHIDLDGTPFYVNTLAQSWQRRDKPRLAAVSSFGYSGTNAHLVVSEAPAAAERPQKPDARLIALSARTAAQLREQARQLVTHIDEHPQESLRDMSFTLLGGRKHFRHRLALVANTPAETALTLRTWLRSGSAASVRTGDNKPQRPVRGPAGPHEPAAREQTDPRRLEQLAEEYAQGGALAFELLFTGRAGRRPGRISLPTYPFAKDTYWLDSADGVTKADRPGAGNARGSAEAGEPRAADTIGRAVLSLEPRWEPRTGPSGPTAEPGGRTVWLVGPAVADGSARALVSGTTELRTFEFDADRPLDAEYLRLTQTLLTDIRTRAGRRAELGESFLQVVVLGHGASALRVMTGVSGLLRTAALEHPWLRTQCVQYLDRVDHGDPRSVAALAESIDADARGSAEQDIRHRGGQAYVRRLAEVPPHPAAAAQATPWREGGVHLITGGLGGLGLILAGELTRTLHTGTVVLVGRSAPDTRRLRVLDALEKPGVTVEYRRADVTDRRAVDELIDDVVARHGAVHGIVHCAGTLHDGYLATKTEAQLRAVLAPKTSGLVNLDEATKDLPLDHLIVFSSTAAVLGNAGQGDYAAANAFLDAYIEHRGELAAQGGRSGHALSVGWPLWADGGMRLDDAALARLRRIGVHPLATEDALQAMSAAVASGRRHTLVLSGDRELLLSRLSPYIGDPTPATAPAPTPVPAVATLRAPVRETEEIWQRTLVAEVSAQLKVPVEEIDVDGEFGEYGFDSISLTELAGRLGDGHGVSVAPTVFFEHTTPARLAAHLARSGPEPVAQAPAGAAESATDIPDLLETARRTLVAEVSAQLKVPVEEIDVDGEFGEYGFDSISLTELAGRLGDRFGVSLAPTVFFEYRTVDSVAVHLVETYADRIAPACPEPSPAPVSVPVPVETVSAADTAETAEATDAPEAAGPAAPIAIIGISGSFPQAPDLDTFWENLRDGKDCISEIPEDRWDWRAMHADPATPRNRKHVRWGGFLDGADRFDPLFFGISPREALAMDPQQRLLLTHAWQALEDAGYAPSSLAGSDTAVIIGTAPSGYGSLILKEQQGEDGYAATGASGSVGPNRVSYLLDLHGPSEPVETACSSSLVAIDRGVELLRSGRSGLALVGGVNTIVSPDLHIGYSRAGMLCEDGRCKTFSARANGYVRGEGVGILVLKPLDRAERDGDRILGVIRGTAVNHGGRAHSLTAPNPHAQAELLKAAYREAGIDPRTVTYIEAHGTGTELGDPVELNGLKSAFSVLHEETQGPGVRAEPARCGLGSVKSNIGHLELAAGVAGVIKVLLQMRHATLAESLHCEELNPYLDFSDSPFEIVRERRPWERLRDAQGRGIPRRAGVSSFGFGGVNAHLVLEEYESPAAHGESAAGSPSTDEISAGRPALITLSARTGPQLVEQARRLRDHLRSLPVGAARLTDLAFTLHMGRDVMEERLASCVTSVAELERRLTSFVESPDTHDNWHRGAVPRRASATTAARPDAGRLAEADRWFAAGEYDHALARWVAGHPVDWRGLYERGPRPARIALPTYPFAEESYWAGRRASGAATAAPAHPMLHRAVPGVAGDDSADDMSPTAYDTVFDGSEPFLRDHRVRGSRVLPGAAHLEMARSAVARAAGAQPASRVRLLDVVWLRPAICGEDRLKLRLGLRPLAEGPGGAVSGYAYTIHSVDADDAHTLCSQGRASLPGTPAERRALPLDALRGVCAGSAFSSAEIYDVYDRVGMGYGPAQRSLAGLTVGADAAGRPQVLAELRLPDAANEDGAAERYGLHPSILDGALQATIGLGLSDDGSGEQSARPALPFALQELDVLAATPATAYAWIRYQDGSSPEDTSAKLDVTLLDEHGQVCVELTGLSARVLPGEPATARPAAAPAEPWTPSESSLAERALPYMRRQLATALQVEVEQLDVDTPLEHYGMDSMMAMELTRHLEDTFGVLPKTLFFEVRTIRALSEHFAEEYAERLRTALGADAQPRREQSGPGDPAPLAPLPAVLAGPGAAVSAPLPVPGTDIAIVGVSGRYPQAENLDVFWQNLRSGRDCITEVPADRWDHRDFGSATSKWGGFLDGVDRFDPLFFHISPREAEYLDPQERLFLECVHHTLEDAGYTGELLARQSAERDGAERTIAPAGKVGVFVGVMYEEYQLHGAQAQARGHQVALSGSPSSIANRISYFYDFHGPSMAVDTMCSSSLTAIHLACEAIRSGQCESAIAGGVNVSVHPNKYLMLGQGKFAASDGRCRSFGEGGDGYVPGEGVGAVLLKPLERALADGDHIHGVIKGTALNHGGRTHGFSVPSPVAQGDVIARALGRAGVDPRSMTYLEAHGTGTSLGDPIELAGLVKAFRSAGGGELPPRSCAIGSVKSNIGHCESAAGIAGVTKVLLQMRHGELAPSLHSRTLNPHIDFDGTPFRVQQHLEPWHGPRIAGVSSFGAGGSNAHVIIAEYEPERGADTAAFPSETASPSTSEPALRTSVVPLSAATEEQLVEQARRLRARLDELTDDDLASVAWTLQTGRVALDERLAFTATSLESVRHRLDAFLADPARPGDWARGSVRPGQETRAADLAAGDGGEGADQGGLGQLVDRWVRGAAVAWERPHPRAGARPPRRVSLPGYPFARERHWLDLTGMDPVLDRAKAPVPSGAFLHPLLHRNDSTAFTLAFRTRFDGAEPFLRDHRVADRHVLPAVAQLEMAREAVARAFEVTEPGRVRLHDVVWLRPVALESDELLLSLRLRVLSADEIEYELYVTGDGGGETLAGRGGATLLQEAPVPHQVSLDTLRERSRGHLEGGRVYAEFADRGLHYGPAYRSIERLVLLDDADGSPQVLAELRAPDGAHEAAEQLCLHPSVLDGALQAGIGLVRSGDRATGSTTAMVPFALDSVQVYAATPERAHVWLRSAAWTYDIDVYDEHGRICVELRGLALRELPPPQPEPGPDDLPPPQPEPGPDDLLLLRPVWEPSDEARGAVADDDISERHVVFVGRFAAGEPDALTAALPASAHHEVVDLAGEEALDQQYLAATQRVFARARGLLEHGVRGPALLQVVLVGDTGASDQGHLSVFGGLSGLLKTVSLENPKLRTQLIDCLDGAAPAVVAGRLRGEPAPEVRYRAGRRQIRRLEEVAGAPRPAATPSWRTGGVYLITGGTGALGLITAAEIAASVESATVVLAGRSALTEEQRQAVEALRAAGLLVDHQRMDVADRGAVDRLVQHIARTHGPLTGVVHSAGVLHDNFVIRKTPQELARVLAPKVAGLVHLDELTRDQPLELFLCFSSTSGALGNPGQADYAAANAFMDAYAAHRNRLAAAGLRAGWTLSVNWPLWEDGGMRADDATKEQLRRMDLLPLDTESGLRALRTGLAAGGAVLEDGRLLVVAGRYEALLPRLTGRRDETRVAEAQGRTPESPQVSEGSKSAQSAQSPQSDLALQNKALRHLRHELATALKLGPDRLDAETPLERYGMDSVVAMNLIAQLEKTFGTLPKTLLFEVQTIRELSEYFVAHHEDELRALFGDTGAERKQPQARSAGSPAGSAAPPVRAELRSRPTRVQDDSATGAHPDIGVGDRTAAASEDVAIIGISGRYPGAPDPDALWARLRTGDDCVTEVPADRWDHGELFDPDRDALGKSYCKWGGFIDGVDQFDPLFFGISPREAETMDPQQRLFLETVWQLLEQSGVTQETIEQRYDRRVGVYVGSMYQMYRADAEDVVRSALTSAASYNLIANRVSHFFGLEGPSLAVDSMCASSATAIHLACADLLRGESELAIAGGVNLTIHPDKYLALSRAQLLGSHPGSRSFRDGDGYLPAEAVGAVLLKPLAAARRDGDTVHAVIKGSASLHGGRGSRFMTPSHKTQVNVMRRALERAGSDPATIGYVEAAANGSALGDAVELSALREVFGAVTEPVALGSVKSNLGHPEAASGIAQLTKVVMQLRHRELAPLASAGAPNPDLRLEDGPLRLCDSLAAWQPRHAGDGVPRRALINSVGAGGSHVSLVVEEAPDPAAGPGAARHAEADPAETQPQLIVLSAQDHERLRTAARLLHEFVERDDSVALADLAHTLQVGREAQPERLAFVVDSRAELAKLLSDFLESEPPHAGLHLGNAEDSAGPLRDLLSGSHGEAFVAGLFADGDLDRLAALWVRGGRIAWNGLHEGRRRRLVPLPTTAFRRKRYWVGHIGRPQPKADHQPRPRPGSPSDAPFVPGGTHNAGADITRYLADYLTEALGLDIGELPVDKDLHGVGVDSILWVRLQRAVEADLGLRLTTREIVELATLERIAAALTAKRAPGPVISSPHTTNDDVREARAKALEGFRQGVVALEDLKALMKEAPGA
ncbi:SDR family NAD(P)-dependent oxidoreductase [Streptomyces sp. H27-C3]|uniref:SDR family NAD(P)-dependent oxidoreductase n=1 Tax=Streptomyces sp. H27-C3 TaxID=3046305 RepID=UPI0024BA166D|nr:SDR family NAD(P)-dependent oxidoreductase [Streptomyces sp. H27-C3]MDJ0460313.1 SDR family NAD(P)-dependent oxidoreductase [Streptomyces sp. H27-C3]